jgi:hypothetical protein
VSDLISDALPFGALWYGEPNAAANAISYAKFYSRSHDAVIRVYDESGSVIAVVAGVQSLISAGLLTPAVLTYFAGRLGKERGKQNPLH